MKTIKTITEATILKSCIKTWGKEDYLPQFNEQAKRFVKCLKKGTIYALVVAERENYDVLKLFEVQPKSRYYYNFNALLMCFGFRVNYHNNVIVSGGNTDTLNDMKQYIIKALVKIGALSKEEGDKLKSIQIPKIYI